MIRLRCPVKLVSANEVVVGRLITPRMRRAYPVASAVATADGIVANLPTFP